MKRISIGLFFALFTFFVSIALTAFWIFNSKLPSVPVPKSEELRASNFVFDSRIPSSEKIFWEKEILKRFKETPLEKLPDSIDESYRLILLPTFDAPVIVRVWRSGNKQFLIAKKLSGQGGFGLEGFGKLSYEKTQPLTEDEWITFNRLVDQAFFWDMPSLENETPVVDGAEWVIEGFKNGVHQEVHRTTPSKEFREACNELLKLSGLEEEYKGY